MGRYAPRSVPKCCVLGLLCFVHSHFRSYWSDATVLDDYAMTTTTTTISGPSSFPPTAFPYFSPLSFTPPVPLPQRGEQQT